MEKRLQKEVVTSHTETSNCDTSSLENDTEMVDHSMNPKFSGASYELCYFLIKARNFFYIFIAFKNIWV